MGGVKENDGKATSARIAIKLLAVFVLAVVAVAGIKTFGTASTSFGHVLRRQASNEAVYAEEDVQQKNIVKFVFSSLDGEAGNEGEVVVKLHPEWAPIGVARIKELTEESFWDGCRAFRVVPNFVIQLGINGDPERQAKWKENLEDDPVMMTNMRGTLTFAMPGKGTLGEGDIWGTRTTQIFFNMADNTFLDKQGFSPFGEVISGMEIVERIYPDYKQEPNQHEIHRQGNAYLEKKFPKLSFIKAVRFISDVDGTS
eukprot:CAMPEP_0172561492 /NCGR_PEP_ID=MMETSP1067-20121228/93101_1 /TAXON_ID=265564 ORGANISM="Thalassiosira punctigera, Strain Tpunct2005C2" /NCGR_SAMPLE_ID=MMETSP1067 /ASSEMBLY_ACC=CAM_ASM_000444 /LENGTH=255 /DNA_ID=CAMNT_0013351537 /DNA_START=52 /DNA_END=819 /DNA_ORIENTATION=+